MKWESPNPPGVVEGAEQVGQRTARTPRTKPASHREVSITVYSMSFPPDHQDAFNRHTCGAPALGQASEWVLDIQWPEHDKQTLTRCPL